LAPKFKFEFEWGFAARNGHMGAAADQDATLSGSNSEFQVLQFIPTTRPAQPAIFSSAERCLLDGPAGA